MSAFIKLQQIKILALLILGKRILLNTILLAQILGILETLSTSIPLFNIMFLSNLCHGYRLAKEALYKVYTNNICNW